MFFLMQINFIFLFVCVTYITFCAPYVVMEPAEFVNIDIR